MMASFRLGSALSGSQQLPPPNSSPDNSPVRKQSGEGPNRHVDIHDEEDWSIVTPGAPTENVSSRIESSVAISEVIKTNHFGKPTLNPVDRDRIPQPVQPNPDSPVTPKKIVTGIITRIIRKVSDPEQNDTNLNGISGDLSKLNLQIMKLEQRLEYVDRNLDELLYSPEYGVSNYDNDYRDENHSGSSPIPDDDEDSSDIDPCDTPPV